MGVYSDVACDEMYASLTESVTDKGLDISVVLRCAWRARWDLINDIMLNRRPYPNTPNPGATHVPLAISAECVPEEGATFESGQSIEYQTALVTVKYSTSPTKSGEDIFSETLESTVEFMTLDYHKFTWGKPGGLLGGDALQENEAPGRQKRGVNLARVMYDVRVPLDQRLIDFEGFVNHDAYHSNELGLSFAAETLLLQPPTLQHSVKSDGSNKWNVSLKFAYQKEGWNQFWRAKTQQYERIWTSGTGAAPYDNYPLADFSDFLF